jgi:hypothetical protein
MACAALAACATEAQRHAKEIGQTVQAAMAQTRQCQSTLEANPRYMRLYEKLAIDTATEPMRAPTPAQLSDIEIIPDDDKAIGFEWYAEGQNCVFSGIEALGRVDPEFQIYFADRIAERAELLNDIAANPLTYGQVNAEIASLKQRDRTAAAEMANNLKARLAAQHQEELAEQQAATEELVSDLGTIALAVATRGRASITRLSSRDNALARVQANFSKAHPRYVIVHPIRAIHCEGVGHSLRCELR